MFIASLPLQALYCLDSWLILNIFGVVFLWRMWFFLHRGRLLHTAQHRSTEWVLVSMIGFLLFGGVFFICNDLQCTLTWFNDSAKQFWWRELFFIPPYKRETSWSVIRHNLFDGVNFSFDLWFNVIESHDFWLRFQISWIFLFHGLYHLRWKLAC